MSYMQDRCLGSDVHWAGSFTFFVALHIKCVSPLQHRTVFHLIYLATLAWG